MLCSHMHVLPAVFQISPYRIHGTRCHDVMFSLLAVGARLVDRGLRVNFIFNSVADAGEARRLIREVWSFSVCSSQLVIRGSLFFGFIACSMDHVFMQVPAVTPRTWLVSMGYVNGTLQAEQCRLHL
jgi:hypothetical protein